MKIIFLFAVSIMILLGCQPDKEIIEGSISGFINTIDQWSVVVNEQSGVEVNLYRDSVIIDSKITDSNGRYTFESLPYGKYRIDLEKEGYVSAWEQPLIHHIGGYSPTVANYQLFEIPTYVIIIDSTSYDQDNYYFSIYVKINGDTLLPQSNYGYIIKAFFGATPEVNKDNKVAEGNGFLTDTDYHTYPQKSRAVVRMNTWYIENDVLLRTGIFYLRLYPLAMGQGYSIHEYLPEALGPPSVNAIEFDYSGLTGNR
jgi:hypothetical protein